MSTRIVLVIGGGGYVGSVLVDHLLNANYKVRVFDTFWYGRDHFDAIDNPNLKLIAGDVRDIFAIKSALVGVSDVIHLACISNDPSFDLNPELAKSINLTSFEPIVIAAKEAGIERFIFASTSSVYGVKTESKVTEKLSLEPLTDYSKYKAECEKILLSHATEKFICTILRPATICGVSPRQRFDLSVNILTNHAVNKNKITVFGGSQQRPNLHIKDMCRSYIHVLEEPIAKISGKIFNVGAENLSLDEIAIRVQQITKMSGSIEHQETNDLRSYRVDSSLIYQQLGFTPNYSIDDAIIEIVDAFRSNQYLDPLNNSDYYNIKKNERIELGMTFDFRRFGFDLDNTIIDYGISVEKYCLNANIPKQEKLTSLRSYLRSIDPSDLKWQEAQSWLYIDGLQYAKLNEGIVDLCVYLLSKDINIFIVSHKTHKTQDRFGGRDLFSPVVNWIQYSNINNFFNINENIYFMPTRDAKIQKIEQLDLNWFVDDLLEVLLDKNFPPHTTKYLLSNDEYAELSADINVVDNFSMIREKLTI